MVPKAVSDACATVPPEQRASYAAMIDAILANADLNTISAKAIRQGMQRKIDYDLAPQKVRPAKLVILTTGTDQLTFRLPFMR